MLPNLKIGAATSSLAQGTAACGGGSARPRGLRLVTPRQLTRLRDGRETCSCVLASEARNLLVEGIITFFSRDEHRTRLIYFQ